MQIPYRIRVIKHAFNGSQSEPYLIWHLSVVVHYQRQVLSVPYVGTPYQWPATISDNNIYDRKCLSSCSMISTLLLFK